MTPSARSPTCSRVSPSTIFDSQMENVGSVSRISGVLLPSKMP